MAKRHELDSGRSSQCVIDPIRLIMSSAVVSNLLASDFIGLKRTLQRAAPSCSVIDAFGDGDLRLKHR